jgi:uncharacterized protein YciI
MHRWIVILEDCEEEKATQIRKKHFSEHFAFLKGNFHRIVFSCGLNDTRSENEKPFGGFWIVEAGTRDEVVALCHQDPYFEPGLRKAVSIFRAHEGYV